jgi:hypothetical protein
MSDGNHEQLIRERPTELDGLGEIVLEETADFPYDDPWSELTRRVVTDLRVAGAFDGQPFFEAGLGDARNALLALDLGTGTGAERVTGIELDDWRLEAAARNLSAAGIEDGRSDLHLSDVVEWLSADDARLSGWGLACLPQAPREATENDADGYQDFGTLEVYHEIPLGDADVDTYGLTLNAAFLDRLRQRVEPGDFDALVTLSGRVPVEVLRELFAETGWKVADVHTAEQPVQQDPDTGVGWTIPFDDGERFKERNPDGSFSPLRALHAEARRRSGLTVVHGDDHAAREALNVYHDLSVFHLQPEAQAA